MLLIDHSILDDLSNQQKDAYRYFPDILPYLHTQRQFNYDWHNLVDAKYLYSDGLDVKPVSWFRYIFESIKGFFGFTNHCQSERVTMGLMKFAYYGYVNGYAQRIQNPTQYPLPIQFAQAVIQPRSNDISALLQQQLINYYVDNKALFNGYSIYYRINWNHMFGISLHQLGADEFIPKIDPTSSVLIKQTVNKLETKEADYLFIPGSNYAKEAAKFHVKKSEENKGFLNSFISWLNIRENQVYKHLKRALIFDPDCKIENIETYIEFYCQNNETDLAFALIKKMDDPNQSISYLIKKPFSTEYLRDNVVRDSGIGIALTKHYLQSSYSQSKVILASQFCSNISEHHPPHAFRYLVSAKKFDQAYQVLKDERHLEYSFDKSSKKTLAKHFDTLGETHYDQGNDKRQQKQWEPAKENYLRSLLFKKKAHDVDPNETRYREYHIHLRLYAQILITVNQHLDIKDVKVDEVNKAVKFLYDCLAKNSDGKEKAFIIKALAKGLMLSADILITRCQVDYMYDNDPETRKRHDLQHKSQMDFACKFLAEIIQLLEGTNNPELIKLLAKANFNLGDMIEFFNLTDQNHNPKDCHRRATQLAPNNPFYLLRYAELMSDSPHGKDLQTKALILLKKAGYTVHQYTQWYDERWHKEKIGYHGIVNIHSAEVPEEKSWLGSFSL